MDKLFRFSDFINEAVNFFEKGKFWSYEGKKVKVITSIPQNKQVLKVQEVDEDGKPVGKEFVASKKRMQEYTQNLFSDISEKDISKKKKWAADGKKVIVIAGAPGDKEKAKVQEVDDNNKIVGEPFIVSKKDVKTWEFFQKKQGGKPTTTSKTESKPEASKEEITKPELSGEKKTDKEALKSTGVTEPKVDAKYKELVAKWKESQKKLGKNTSPGEGTRARLMKQAQLEAGYDETKADADIASLKKGTAYDAVDRLTTLVKDKKVKSPDTVLKYLDFIKKKIGSGVNKISPN